MSSIEALIFDLDGVLVDTVDLHYQSWAEVAQQLGIAFTATMMTRFRGRHQVDCMRELLVGRETTDLEIAAYLAAKDASYLRLLAQADPEALLMPHVLPFLAGAQARGLQIAVASSSVNALYVLQQVGLLDRFAVVADGHSVVRSKPAPDIFLWTAGALRVHPARCLVFEDSHAGVIAAHLGGMAVVGLGQLEAPEGADLVIADLGALSMDEILNAMRQHHSAAEYNSAVRPNNHRRP